MQFFTEFIFPFIINPNPDSLIDYPLRPSHSERSLLMQIYVIVCASTNPAVGCHTESCKCYSVYLQLPGEHRDCSVLQVYYRWLVQVRGRTKVRGWTWRTCRTWSRRRCSGSTANGTWEERRSSGMRSCCRSIQTSATPRWADNVAINYRARQ